MLIPIVKQPDHRVVLFAFLAVFLPGCEDTGTGEAHFAWSVGLTGSCQLSRLRDVEVRLHDGSGRLVAAETAPCETGELRLFDAPEGTYRARFVAYDDEGAIAYDALVDDVRVVPAAVESETYFARLAPRPASVRVVWYFHGGRLCSTYGVEDVAVPLFADDRERTTKGCACEDGDLLVEDVDPDSYGIRVEGLDESGSVTHTFTIGNVQVRPGHAVEIDAPLAPCEDADCR